MTPAEHLPIGDTPLEAALRYAAHGWRVLPIKPGQKSPPMNSWQHAATTNERTIRNWYNGLYRDHGVGIATGEESGIFVLDVDVSEGKHGDDTLADLEARYSKLPDTVRSITGSKGTHIFFRHPVGLVVRNNASTKLGPGLDIRGRNGQVVAAPTVHPNGTPYEWEHGYSPDDIAVADAPDWLIDLITEPPHIEPPPAPAPLPATTSGTSLDDLEDSIAATINRTYRWHDVLTNDGWTLHSAAGTDTMWTRPGKNRDEGASAILHEPSGPFVVFSTDVSLSHLHDPARSNRHGDGWSYSLFGYLAATDYGGDRAACARAERIKLNATQQPATSPSDAPESLSDSLDYADEIGANLIDWGEFWREDHNEAQWIAEPFIADKRGHSIFAIGGTGKSLLALWIAAAIATGRPIFGQHTEPRNVLYMDYEMTKADLYERLEAMGYGPDIDMTRLHYAMLPSLPPLDTEAGGQRLRKLAAHVNADVVVIDTYGRAVEGDENDADTTRAFYRHAGMGLKADGRTWLRIDHAGKDAAKGQRGSSAKNDDVDVVWQMSVTDTGYTMKATKRRMGWVPETVGIIKREDPELGFELADVPGVPAGTLDAVTLLDRLDVPVTASHREAARMVREAGQRVRNNVLRAAVRVRRDRAEVLLQPVDNPAGSVPKSSGHASGDDSGARVPTQRGTNDKTPGQTVGHTSGHTGAHLSGPSVPECATRRGAHGTGTGAQPPTDNDEHPNPPNPPDPFDDLF